MHRPSALPKEADRLVHAATLGAGVALTGGTQERKLGFAELDAVCMSGGEGGGAHKRATAAESRSGRNAAEDKDFETVGMRKALVVK